MRVSEQASKNPELAKVCAVVIKALSGGKRSYISSRRTVVQTNRNFMGINFSQRLAALAMFEEGYGLIPGSVKNTCADAMVMIEAEAKYTDGLRTYTISFWNFCGPAKYAIHQDYAI